LAPYYEGALSLLPPARRAKTERLRRPADRLRSLAAWLLLRRFLGARGDSDIKFGPWGRPELAKGGPAFSLSHSGDFSALSVSDAAHGLDLEGLARPVNFQAVLPRILSPAEAPFAKSLAQSPEGFFFVWTRKEALMKALGLGFQLDPRAFGVWPPAPEPVRMLERDWFFQTIVEGGHMFSLASESEPLGVALEEALPEDVLG
jgi:4'-phosphopantetheinyl transferase